MAKEKIKKVEVGFGGITADLKHGFVNNIIDLCERTYLPFMIVESRLWQKQLDSFREQLSSKIDTFVTNEDVFKIYPQMLAKPLLPVFLPYTDTYNHYYDFHNRFIGSRDNYRETAMLLGERQFNYYYNLHIWNTKDGYERNRSYLKGLISSAQEKNAVDFIDPVFVYRKIQATIQLHDYFTLADNQQKDHHKKLLSYVEKYLKNPRFGFTDETLKELLEDDEEMRKAAFTFPVLEKIINVKIAERLKFLENEKYKI